MGIAERVRDTVRPTNSIEPVRPSESTARVAADHASPSPVGDTASKKPTNDYTKQALDRYFVENNKGDQKYYDDYQKRSLAFTANAAAVTTKREDLNTVKAVVAQAELRGWQTVEIKGTTEFKREAWIETQTRGIESRGYRPSEPDRQEADRRRTERERGQTNEVRPVAQGSGTSRVSSSEPAQSVAAPPIAVAREATDRRSGPRAVASETPVNEAVRSAATNAASPKSDVAALSLADNRKAVRDAQTELSPDARVVLSALSEKIDRQFNKFNLEAKVQLKAFVATELVKKERSEGPVVLSAEQKQAASAPEPVRQVARGLEPRRVEPESPRRSIGGR